MNKCYLDFLNQLNIKPTVNQCSDKIEYNKKFLKEKILKEYIKSLENFEFSLITFKQSYPKKNASIITKGFKVNQDIFETRFDTTLLIDCYDVEKKISYNLSDLFYSSEEVEEKACEQYNKIYEILEKSNTIDAIFTQLSKLLII